MRRYPSRSMLILAMMLILSGCGSDELSELKARADNYEEDAMYELASIYLESESDEATIGESFELLKWASDVGHIPSQLKLGQMLIDGEVFDENISEGISLLERAGFEGSLDAQLLLVSLFGNSTSASDESKLRMWLEYAAEQGHSDSQLQLGLLFERGTDNIDASLERAIYWIGRASESGNELAQKERARIDSEEAQRLDVLAAEESARSEQELFDKQVAQAPKYTDSTAVFRLKENFQDAMRSLGFLENAPFLPEQITDDVLKLRLAIDELRRIFVSDYTTREWDSAESLYESSKQTATNINPNYNSAASALLCDTVNSDRGPSSQYVTRINENVQRAHRALNTLQRKLPEPKDGLVGSELLVGGELGPIENWRELYSTAVEYEVGELQTFCRMSDGSINPLEQAYIERRDAPAALGPKRVAPFSSMPSDSQAEMICRNLEDIRIPPPQILSERYTCVENFEQ